jgi:hypothetical protein
MKIYRLVDLAPVMLLLALIFFVLDFFASDESYGETES